MRLHAMFDFARSAGRPMAVASVGAQHAVPAVKTGNPEANWPRPAFRSAGVPPVYPERSRRALLTFSSVPQITGLARPMPAAGFAEETFYVVKSYNNIGIRAHLAVVCRAGG